MNPRINFSERSPELAAAMRTVDEGIASLWPRSRIRALVQLHVATLNGCNACVASLREEARATGISPHTMDAIVAWRAEDFTTREKTALAWSEALTSVARVHPSDNDYAALALQFTEAEIIGLTWGVVSANGWNRLVIASSCSASSG